MAQKTMQRDQSVEDSSYGQGVSAGGKISGLRTCCMCRYVDDQLVFDFTDKGSSGSAFRDPAFSENRTQPLHRWVPWIAGFSAQFVQDCFERFLERRAKKASTCVLDPFAGVGTTLVQALLNGLDYIGFEINPYAVLACKAKLNSVRLDVEAFEKWCLKYEELVRRGYKRATPRRPIGFESRIPFFSPSVEEQVVAFLDIVESIPNPDIADLFRVAFGSVMVSFSNYTYEPSLGSRPAAGKPLIQEADVHSAILGKLYEMMADIQWVQQRFRDIRRADGQVHNLNFLESEGVLPARSVDLVVTSPPYMNNYHYVRNTRPQLFWLSLVSSPKDLRRLEEANFGKYWQTVRDSEPIGLNFGHPELSNTLTRIRQTRAEKGPYGGPGWANYVAAYFNDCYRFCGLIKRALRPRGVAVVVIGNSIIHGHEVKTDLVLADIAGQHGLQLIAVEQIRSKRVGASITTSAVRQGEPNQATLYESAVILKKS